MRKDKLVVAFECMVIMSALLMKPATAQQLPAVSGKTVFGIPLGVPLALPLCPVKMDSDGSYVVDTSNWEKNENTCYWYPHSNSTNQVVAREIYVQFNPVKRPRLPGIPDHNLTKFALDDLFGTVRAFNIGVSGVANKDIVASLSTLFGNPIKTTDYAIPEKFGKGLFNRYVKWTFGDLDVVIIGFRDEKGPTQVTIGDRMDKSAETAVRAVNATRRARAQTTSAGPNVEPALPPKPPTTVGN